MFVFSVGEGGMAGGGSGGYSDNFPGNNCDNMSKHVMMNFELH
jgi:hypothetical protein